MYPAFALLERLCMPDWRLPAHGALQALRFPSITRPHLPALSSVATGEPP